MLNSLVRLGLRWRLALTVLVCFGLLFLSLALLPSRSGARQQPHFNAKGTRPRFVPGEVLVRYRSEATAQRKTGKQVLSTIQGRRLSAQVERFDGSDLVEGLRMVRVAPEDTLSTIAALRTQPDVMYAEPNYIMRAAVVPNDEHFQAGRLYGLAKINAQPVWDNFTTGSSNVVVGVIDQGIDITHADLQPNIWTNPAEIAGNGVDDDANGFIDDIRGFNFVNNNGTVFSNTDPETHASHVAGIIGARGNNSIGTTGVNWTVGLMSLKFLDAEGFGDTADAIAACNYAKQMRDLWVANSGTKGANVRVLNASFGGAAFTQSFLDSINALNSSGILFVAASGNVDNGTLIPNNDLVPHFPAGFNAPNILAVAATNQSDNIPPFSHFGATSVDLGAPGEAILSTTPSCTNPGPFPDFPCEPTFADPTQDTYTFFSGTSMSTPFVSGAAALLWAHNPNLTVQQVKNLLLFNGDVQASLVNKSLSGRRLNVGNSFQSLQETDTTAPGAVTNLQITSQTGRTINLSWTAAGDDGSGGGAAALYEVNLVDGVSSAVIPLKGVIPATPGSSQSTSVTLPYRHPTGTIRVRAFDNKGNEGTPANIPVSVPLVDGDPYTTSVGSAAALSTGGTLIDINGDDRYRDQLLPTGFTFPFFGSTFTEVIISSNGNLYFSPPPERIGLPPGVLDIADDPPGSPRSLGGFKMIAGLWEDLDLTKAKRADAGVYVVQPSASRLIFRWQGVLCEFNGSVCTGTNANPINFEIELNTNGTIKTRYGTGGGNANVFPTVGIGGGDQDGYVITSHTSEETPISMSAKGEVTFTPRATATGGVQFSQATFNVSEAAGSLNINITRTGDTSGAGSVNFATTDNFGANCSQVTGTAAANCDFNSAGTTLQFAAGETSKTVTLSIVNDGYVEGNENFTLTLSNPTGMSLGTPATATITIVDNDSTNTNPFDNNPFFVRQQYLDFLFREPDTGGFNDWLNVLNTCGPNQGGLGSPIGCDRVHVSSGFFRSTEFGERGYWAYRYYHGTIGRRPQFAEFVPDMRRLSGNAQQEAARDAFVADFMQKPEFTALYAGLTNAGNAAQFIAKLEQTAGVTLPASNTTLPGQPPQFGRAELIAKMSSGEFTAAQTLRAFIEQKVVFDAFFFRAFVAMQYFGYLLRDPEDAGYNDWVDVLTNGRGTIPPGDFRHLIFGFVWSVEYRQRFGP